MSDFVTEGYWRQIQELQKENARLKKCEQFVKDFIQYGFRIDTMPTRMLIGTNDPKGMKAQQEEYMWWHEYVKGAEGRLIQSAQEVLSGDKTDNVQ